MVAITRLAPSPTGALHLGNARTFLINWLLARQMGWRIALRIEDLDGPRVKPDADRQLIKDLRWLGLNWDTGPVWQSARRSQCHIQLERLLEMGLAYPCICSRKEALEAASAPHREVAATVYPGTCRDRWKSVEDAFSQTGRTPAIRFRVPPGEIEFSDQFAGRQRIDPQRSLGDFIISKADGTPAYQLAVVVDDFDAGVTHVVRGDDLLDSTPRQMLLYRALGWAGRIPTYTHVPLVIGADGRRLAKRHGDTRLSRYRNAGVPAARVVSLLARWCGMDAGDAVEDLNDLIPRFALSRVSRDPVIMTAEDDAWLLR